MCAIQSSSECHRFAADLMCLAEVRFFCEELGIPTKALPFGFQVVVSVIGNDEFQKEQVLWVRSRTTLINCAGELVKPMGLRLPGCSTEAFPKRAASTPLPDILRLALEPLLKQIESVNQGIREYDPQIERIAATQYPETVLLKKI